VPRTPKNNAWLIVRKRQMQLAVSLSLDMGAGCTLKMLGQAAGIHHINALCFQMFLVRIMTSNALSGAEGENVKKILTICW